MDGHITIRYDPSDQAKRLYEKYSTRVVEHYDLRKLYDPLFETYVHDSVAAYRLVDGYLQSRNIFYFGESRWVKEDNT